VIGDSFWHQSLGTLVTRIPRRVAASTSTISTPVPYRAMTLQRVRASIALAPTVAYWTMIASASRADSMTSSSVLQSAATSRRPASSMIARSMSTSP
jgi:hypothetical protein